MKENILKVMPKKYTLFNAPIMLLEYLLVSLLLTLETIKYKVVID